MKNFDNLTVLSVSVRTDAAVAQSSNSGNSGSSSNGGGGGGCHAFPAS